jgi:hypothetical protein
MTHISVIYIFYLLHICTTFQLHVPVYLTPSSGRNCALVIQNHLLFRSSCLWYSDGDTKYKTQRRFVYNNFYNGYGKQYKVVACIFYEATTVPKTTAAKQQVVSSTEQLSSPWRWCKIRGNMYHKRGSVQLAGAIKGMSNVWNFTDWNTSKWRNKPTKACSGYVYTQSVPPLLPDCD